MPSFVRMKCNLKMYTDRLQITQDSTSLTVGAGYLGFFYDNQFGH